MSYQTKHDARIERRRKAWLPLFGFVSLVVFGAFSYVVAPTVRPIFERFIEFPDGLPAQAPDLIVAFILFVILFAVAMVLAAVLAGPPRDPRDVRAPSKRMKKRIDERARKSSKF